MFAIQQKFKTLINRPFEAIKKYGYIAQDKLVGYRVPRLNHNYERFFRVEKGDVVIDIGAELGLFTLSTASRASRVVAIEPEPKNLRCLRYNVSRRGFENVLVVEKVVWNRKTDLPLFLSRLSGDHSVIRDVEPLEASRTNRQITVKADTLDNVLAELNISRVGFIKIDIEGAEIEALEGAKETLKKTAKIVVAAYHKRNGIKTLAEVNRKLNRSGFQTRVTKDDLVYGFKK